MFAFASVLLLAAQTFEVASVKPAAPYKGGPIHIAMAGGPGTEDPGRLTFSNATLRMVLNEAFNVSENQKVDGPDWLHDDMFDIVARLAPGATRDQMRAMLRNLLEERFHMAWHREKQDLPAYSLVRARGRVRLAVPRNPAGEPTHREKSHPGIRSISCDNCTVGQFVKALGYPEGRTVFDETGLGGAYDFSLTYEPDYGVCKGCVVGGAGASAPPPPPLAEEAPPILSVALEEQLGLKLEKRKQPVDVLVIERIDRLPASQ